MAIMIRKAEESDAAHWLQLLKDALGADPVAEQVYRLSHVASQLFGPGVEETWLAIVDGKMCGSISILAAGTPNANPVANLGRLLVLPEIYLNGAAEALLGGISEVCVQRQQMAVLRVPSSDLAQQSLLEKLHYVCVGFQPLKHLCMVREGMLFYVQIGTPTPIVRLPISHPLAQITELAWAVLSCLDFPPPAMLRNGLTGYPLQTDLIIEEATPADYDAWLQSQAAQSPVEISGYYNRGLGLLRVASAAPLQALLARNETGIVGGLCYFFDEQDRCVRLVDSFATDDFCTGALMQRVVKLAQDPLNAVYVEVDFLITAPRVLKSAEQLGFMPVAFLPGFYNADGCGVDVVKMVKLNAAYSLDNLNLTPAARIIVDLVDRSFQDQKVGVAVINLLRGLPIFADLGDGELTKMARLFTQKLYRPNEKVFSKGELSNEGFIVMRGQVDIFLEANTKPVASIGSGAIVGEQAFLDGSPRTAFGIAAQPSILLVVQHAAFNRLIRNEPHLGMVVMRNIAIEVSNKLRRANHAVAVGAK